MNRAFSESVVEDAALAWLENAGWRVAHGHDISPDMPAAERRDAGNGSLADAHMPKLAEARP
jgi:type I restriction enzyme R subunit